jgi:S-formylglutathione hydrolase FrmB
VYNWLNVCVYAACWCYNALQNKYGPFPAFERVLIDQGTGDEFYEKKELRPEVLQEACKQKGQKLDVSSDTALLEIIVVRF